MNPTLHTFTLGSWMFETKWYDGGVVYCNFKLGCGCMIRENDCILMCSCTLSLIQKSKQSKRCSMFHNDSIIVIMIMDNVRYSYRVSITVECESCCGTIPAPRGRWRYTCKRSAQTFGGKASLGDSPPNLWMHSNSLSLNKFGHGSYLSTAIGKEVSIGALWNNANGR